MRGHHTRAALLVAIAAAVLLGASTNANAALVDGAAGPPLANIFQSIAKTVLGGLEWTVDIASSFVLNTLAGVVKLLIPDAWTRQGLALMQWIVAVPSYGAQIVGPTGTRTYGMGGVNALRELMLWIGMALLPLTLTWASVRSAAGLGDNPLMPFLRVVVIALLMLSYTWWWAQAAALVNQLSAAVFGLPQVRAGIEQLFVFLIGGAGVAGASLVGLIVLAIAGVYLLIMIAMKVVLVLAGALVFATGPLMLGISPTERGSYIAKAWLTAATAVLLLPLLWTIVFAIAAVLMFDAGSPNAAALIGGDRAFGKVFGGLILGMAAIAGFWLNIKIAKGVAGIVSGQLTGMLALAGRSAGGATTVARGAAAAPARAGAALSTFQQRVAPAGAAGAFRGRVGSALAAGGALATGGAAGLATRAAANRSTAGAGATATRLARKGGPAWTARRATAETGAAAGRPSPADPLSTSTSGPHSPSPDRRTDPPVAGPSVGVTPADPGQPGGSGVNRPSSPTPLRVSTGHNASSGSAGLPNGRTDASDPPSTSSKPSSAPTASAGAGPRTPSSPTRPSADGRPPGTSASSQPGASPSPVPSSSPARPPAPAAPVPPAPGATDAFGRPAGQPSSAGDAFAQRSGRKASPARPADPPAPRKARTRFARKAVRRSSKPDRKGRK